MKVIIYRMNKCCNYRLNLVTQAVESVEFTAVIALI